ncbi:MAG: transcriptional repressor LexA [PVC group bacterium]
MKDLTEKQRAVLEFIIARREEGGAPPTLEEIREHFGWRAIGTVQDHLRALVEKEYLGRSRSARGLRVLRDPDASAAAEDGVWSGSRQGRRPAAGRTVLVPVVGAVAAGRPILAVEQVEEEWFLDRKLVRGRDNFLLRARGESMIGAQIRDGDYLLVRPQAAAENGEIVVVMLDDEVTVKRFYRRRNAVELRAENPAYRPIVFRGGKKNIEIVGKVVGVLRKY